MLYSKSRSKFNLVQFPPTLVRWGEPVLVKRHGAVHAEEDSKAILQKVLDSIFPPRRWREEDQKFQQLVSIIPATRQEVLDLQDAMNAKLEETQAHETGLCPKRRDIYKQCFDELIRQVVIICEHRGRLLVRVRDEIELSMNTNEEMYASATEYGMRKTLDSHKVKDKLRGEIITLEENNEELERKIRDLELEIEAFAREVEQLRETETKKYHDEILILKKTNTQLKSQLEGILAPKK